ncbi:hypothetical protein BC830DRAFT_1100972 [Chytriomyces sp. MP71]|nr:hypothetical protein BC830DRAFT_1110270 [Chytriomyces sp. MP71]KAI8620035.1 hypothetical protein BC830DRAFT_1100972 [Chytriomyces sp. MP71]
MEAAAAAKPVKRVAKKKAAVAVPVNEPSEKQQITPSTGTISPISVGSTSGPAYSVAPEFSDYTFSPQQPLSLQQFQSTQPLQEQYQRSQQYHSSQLQQQRPSPPKFNQMSTFITNTGVPVANQAPSFHQQQPQQNAQSYFPVIYPSQGSVSTPSVMQQRPMYHATFAQQPIEQQQQQPQATQHVQEQHRSQQEQRQLSPSQLLLDKQQQMQQQRYQNILAQQQQQGGGNVNGLTVMEDYLWGGILTGNLDTQNQRPVMNRETAFPQFNLTSQGSNF